MMPGLHVSGSNDRSCYMLLGKIFARQVKGLSGARHRRIPILILLFRGQ